MGVTLLLDAAHGANQSAVDLNAAEAGGSGWFWRLSSQGLLKDVGFGLRLGNSRSALGNVLHLDVAFPLDGDSSIDSVQFLVETQRSF